MMSNMQVFDPITIGVLPLGNTSIVIVYTEYYTKYNT
uniref:Uncharacterized protein n=1 Tax=Myoviridae sp. ctZgq1 TaxID=2826666 RepID=A0A8S5LX99_9CAUD|nr:MAG TPA: hypothetical protein [Myoviridae sp. ctZgq1]